MPGTLRKGLYLLRHESKSRWIAIILLAIGVAVIEAGGALLVFLLLGLITSPDTPIELPVIGDFRELPFIADPDQLTLWVAASVAAFFILRGLFVLGQLYAQDRLAHNAGARLAVRLLSGYLAMPYAMHIRRNSAELIRNAYESVRKLTSELIIPTVRLLSHIVLAIGMLSVLLFVAPIATLLAIGFLSPVVLLLLRVIHPRLKRLGKGRQRLSKESLSILQQSLHGIREVILFDRAEFFQRRFAKKQHGTARVTYLNRIAQEVPRLLIETVLVVSIAGFFIVSTTLQQRPEETLTILGLFAYAALRLQPSLQKIVQSLNSIRFAGAAVDNVYDDLILIESNLNGEHRPTIAEQPLTTGGPPEIRLEGVSFRYTDTSDFVLRDINLVIHPGDAIGIVGPTGGGKSTLLDVLVGLLPPTEGRVLIDGRDLHQRTAQWHRCLGVVPQAIFLIDDTLRRNIALGVANHEIDEERLRRAVELAQLTPFVEDLPAGLETTVGERGVRMSGGQRQRVAIARALYRDPPVLIFDEGTSALDSKTEANLIRAIDRLGENRTVITVAHRLSTVRRCDWILIIKQGRIADCGTYDQLLTRNREFRAAAQGTS